MNLSPRLTPAAVPRRERPCTTCQDWGTVPDPERRGQFKPCPEQCAASQRITRTSQR